MTELNRIMGNSLYFTQLLPEPIMFDRFQNIFYAFFKIDAETVSSFPRSGNKFGMTSSRTRYGIYLVFHAQFIKTLCTIT